MIATYQTNQRTLNLDEDASLKDILDVNKDKALRMVENKPKLRNF
ncbi:hypothetical protein [Staphylococcus borealis]